MGVLPQISQRRCERREKKWKTRFEKIYRKAKALQREIAPSREEGAKSPRRHSFRHGFAAGENTSRGVKVSSF